jgi:hypothetical protein
MSRESSRLRKLDAHKGPVGPFGLHSTDFSQNVSRMQIPGAWLGPSLVAATNKLASLAATGCSRNVDDRQNQETSERLRLSQVRTSVATASGCSGSRA